MEYKKSHKKWSNKDKTILNPSPLTLNQGRPEPKRKRGKLASLMTEEAKATASIHELSYDFACRITRLFQYLTEDAEYKEYVQSKQLYRSGTLIGANVREGKHAHDNGYLDDKQFNSLENDITRILKILTSIVKTMRIKLGLEKP